MIAAPNGRSLAGRTLYIPQMAYAGGRMIAAAFRSIGIDATVAPDSDSRTLELGGLHTSGEECLPHTITLGDFLKVCHQPDFDPGKTAFFMPTSHGPCRFGQYAPYLKQELAQMGFADVLVVSPTTGNSYDGINEHASRLMQTTWMGVICGDLAVRLLLKTRPYETNPGETERVYRKSVDDFAAIVSRQDLRPRQLYRTLVETVEQVRDRFRAVPANYVKGRPLIGIVGEIFCRLNTFANADTTARIERLGGECWMTEFTEWVWYTNWGQGHRLRRARGRLNFAYLMYAIKTVFQRRYLHGLLAPVADDFKGYEEPHDVREVLEAARPYLPAEGCLGEMVLSVGKANWLCDKGIDGIIDISPFTCMNGIICESVYPAVSDAHDGLPIRSLYFDGANTSIDRDLEIFLDIARAYQKRKRHARIYPRCFRD